MKDLKGIIVPLLTPLTGDGHLDEAGLGRLTERLLRAGVHGFFVAGTTGEFLALPAEVRKRSFAVVTAATAGAAMVVGGVTAGCRDEMLRHGEAAVAAGVDAVSLLPPPYFPLTGAELGDYYDAAIEALPLPVVVYNFPALAGKAIPPALMARLAAHPRVIGMKDSSGDFDYFGRVVDECRGPAFRVLIGTDTRLVEGLARGADGGVPGLANLAPEPFVRCYESFRAGDLETAQAAQREIVQIMEPYKNGGKSWLDMIRWMKQELHREGVCEPGVAGIFGAPCKCAPFVA